MSLLLVSHTTAGVCLCVHPCLRYLTALSVTAIMQRLRQMNVWAWRRGEMIMVGENRWTPKVRNMQEFKSSGNENILNHISVVCIWWLKLQNLNCNARNGKFKILHYSFYLLLLNVLPFSSTYSVSALINFLVNTSLAWDKAAVLRSMITYTPCISAKKNKLLVGIFANTASKIVKRAFSVNVVNRSCIK